MPTIRDGIYSLLSAVEIDTKEEGRVHVDPWHSQRMVIDMIADGLENDVHEFVILKSRQMAITTVCSIIELFWALANPGVQAAIIADRTDNLERLRRIFASLLQTLPAEWRGREHELTQNNRNGMAFANRSVIDLLAAANNPDLGASRSLSMMHATECSLWKNMAGVESLRAALARRNPRRLFVWEAIANGFNWWHGFCQQAKSDRHMRFCFIGFWANPTYSIPKSDPDYKTYWDNRLTEDEIQRARYVKHHYKYTITPEQIAWWRRENEYRAEEYCFRHYPWTEKECFIASGTGFFPAKKTLEIGEQLAQGPPYRGYRYKFQDQFLFSSIEQIKDRTKVHLRVWEPPDPNGIYVVGVDPSGGGGGDANDHCIQVLRCYADRLVQVAEFVTNEPLTYQMAWVMCHLCGSYRNHTCNMEVSGIGAAVLPEIRNLRQMAERGMLQSESHTDAILKVIGNVRWYLYSRPDSLGGPTNFIAWKTNADNKMQIFSEVRDSLMLDRIEVRSIRLVQQLQAVVEDQGWLGAGPDTGEGDDAVMAFALAHHPWVERLRPGLVARGLTWKAVHAEPPPQDVGFTLSIAYSDKIQQINRKSRERRERF
jgi:hypothetical protein